MSGHARSVESVINDLSKLAAGRISLDSGLVIDFPTGSALHPGRFEAYADDTGVAIELYRNGDAHAAIAYTGERGGALTASGEPFGGFTPNELIAAALRTLVDEARYRVL